VSGAAVVVFSGSECEEHPGRHCVMQVLHEPGMTWAEAHHVASLLPDWTTPHVIPVMTPGEYLDPEYLHLET